ncbi:type-F conjugative transfer system pilin assembly protein TrbC [Cysteiniphilum marinum]|uniref:type-F conjugative transfer system pilin assembly protein TrbC n=1 Tax=Cysteiniphilum marinum TaxID=2774191 RepID=UPI001939EE63|nr:type-F conjugative transfer system pilin assembly protein TrbC [Cysteiniphilum marinum]
MFKSTMVKAGYLKPYLSLCSGLFGLVGLAGLTALGGYSLAYANVQTVSQYDVQALYQSSMDRAQLYQPQALNLLAQGNEHAKEHEAHAKAIAQSGIEKAQAFMQQAIDQSSVLSTEFKGVMVFVSFSMPDELLKLIIKQADQLAIPVLVQGFYKDDFRATVKRIEQIILPDGLDTKNPPKGGFSFDPMRFKQYGIEQVPAFVVANPKDVCKSAKIEDCIADQSMFDVVYGNLSVKDGLSILYNKGSDQFKPVLAEVLAKAKP